MTFLFAQLWRPHAKYSLKKKSLKISICQRVRHEIHKVTRLPGDKSDKQQQALSMLSQGTGAAAASTPRLPAHCTPTSHGSCPGTQITGSFQSHPVCTLKDSMARPQACMQKTIRS